MIVDESPVTNEEQDTTINIEEEDNSVSTSGEENIKFSFLKCFNL